MKYMGSKNRIAKHLLPTMLVEAEKNNITTWVEPFVGGANMIDKVPDTYKRVGYDFNDHAIHALIGIRDNVEQFPDNLNESEYNKLKGLPPCTIGSWVRIACSFGGIFESKLAADKTGLRNYAQEAKRNALRQSPKIQNVDFICDSYENLDFENCLIYCDPPYQGTSGYKTGAFDHEKFFDWCRNQAKKNIVFVSEYNAPDDFTEVWRGEVKTNFASTRKKATHNAVEKLFRVY
ncbi:site-specific DNA-adenine methylase [Thermovibrio guaymasensis]|uniref:site-specific DNA-methyltransferase (adenine-specific) n=1 Tax=Thermovibrio guaymasensis TaxID=240167 RepID=A0A420W5G0_9BACT|nr:DNA adenine methylase [Thermovibrio guaymasensis]RKQ59864.1 site-specific DNA-adenine methylase [Thermovibrio guaymasensis]